MTVRLVACPQCGASAEWNPENRFRPFCSERCKMIDLGAWATERYRVPVIELDDAELPTEDLEERNPRPS
ncbi:MAG: DNA gyrase inhibitor YacG [Burkholderiales bacterium]